MTPYSSWFINMLLVDWQRTYITTFLPSSYSLLYPSYDTCWDMADMVSPEKTKHSMSTGEENLQQKVYKKCIIVLTAFYYLSQWLNGGWVTLPLESCDKSWSSHHSTIEKDNKKLLKHLIASKSGSEMVNSVFIGRSGTRSFVTVSANGSWSVMHIYRNPFTLWSHCTKLVIADMTTTSWLHPIVY